MNIDPATQPGAAWEHTAVIAGVRCPLLPPCRVDGDPKTDRPVGLVRLPLVLWWAVRVVLLGTDPRRVLREQVRSLVEPGHRDLVDRERVGVLAEIVVSYKGLQSGYQASLVQHAQDAAMREAMGDSIAQRARAVGGAMGGSGSESPKAAPTRVSPRSAGVPIRPGEALPHALVRANGGSGRERFGAGVDESEGGATG